MPFSDIFEAEMKLILPIFLQITLFLTHPVHIYNIYSDIYTAGPPDLDDVGYRTVLAFSNPGYSQRVAHIRSVELDNEGQYKQ